jgi:hypothetical protein
MLSCIVLAGSAWIYLANDIEKPSLFNLSQVTYITQDGSNVVFDLNTRKLGLENFTVPQVVSVLDSCDGNVFLENDEADSE